MLEMRETHSSSSAPARLSSIEYNDALPLCPVILTQKPGYRRASYPRADDNNVSLGRKLFCRSMPKQELIRLAVPERIR
jgi:hypothetical protein